MNDIKNSLIKIANHKPSLKKDLINILEQASNKQEAIKGLIKLAYVNPEIREYAIPLIKQGGIKDIKRKQERAEKKQQEQAEKKKSQIPKNVADAAKNKNFSSIPLKEYMRQELGNKKLPNPALKDNPNAQKEVVITTVLNRAADPNDPLQQDAIKLVEPLLQAIVKEDEKGEGGEGKEVGGEEETPVAPKPVAEEDSPQGIVQNSEARLDQQIQEELTEEKLNQPKDKLDEWVDTVAEKHLKETLTEVFENLRVPNAKDVGEGVVEAKREETAVEKGRRELDQKMEAHKKNMEFRKEFNNISQHLLNKNLDILSEASEGLEGLPEGQLPDKSIEDIKKDFEDFKKNPNMEKARDLLSVLPKTMIDSIKKNTHNKIKVQREYLNAVNQPIALKEDIKDIKLDEVKSKDDDTFIGEKDSSAKLKSSGEDLLNDPSKEKLENTLSNLPESVANKVVEDLKENGVNEASVKAVAMTANNVSQMLDDHNNEDSLQMPVAPSEELPEPEEQKAVGKLKALKDNFLSAFQTAKDFVKHISILGTEGGEKATGKYLQERGLNLSDLKGEKREQALKAMGEFKNIHETNKVLSKELIGVPQDKIEEIGRLKDNLSAKEYSKIIKKIKGEDNLKDIVGDEEKFKAFKDNVENHKDILNKAKDIGLGDQEFDEESSKRVKELHNLLKDKNISNSEKKELAKDFVKGKLNKDDIDLFNKVRLKKDLSDEDKQNLGEGSDLQKFRNLKKHNEKQELIKEFTKGKKYKDETVYGSPEVSYDEIVALSKSEDEDDKKWAKNKLKEIEKDYDKDVQSKNIMKDKEREEIEKLFKTESGEDIKLRDDREGVNKKYTLNQVYEMADNSDNPKDQAWASKKIEEIRKSMSGETEATKEEIKEEKKKELEKEKSELATKLKEQTEKVVKDHSESIKKIDDHHNSEKDKIEKGVAGDIEKIKKDHETKMQQKRDEADVKINDILKTKGFDVNSEKEKIDKDYEANIATLLGQDNPDKIKEFENKKNKSLQDLESKRQELMKSDPSIDQINKDFNNNKRTEEGHLTKKIKKKEKQKEDSLSRLETETMASKAIADQKKDSDIKQHEKSHSTRTEEIENEIADSKMDKAFEGASNLSPKQKKNLKNELDSFEKELDGLDEEEAEDRSRELVKKVRSTGKGNKELERLIMENNKALLDMYYGRGGEKKAPKKTETKKTTPKKTTPETEDLDSILEEGIESSDSDESMTSFFSGKTFTYTHNVDDGTDKGIDRKKNVDFKELLDKYRKTKSKKNPFNEITTKNIQKSYEDAKKTYEQQTKKQNKKANDKNSKAEEIKQRIKEKSKFDEKDFEDLKPYFGEDLRFDKERYLADKKKLNAEKARELEEKRTKFELEKTKMEVMELKKQMASLSESKKASLKKQIVKIALSSKKEIQDIILPLI